MFCIFQIVFPPSLHFFNAIFAKKLRILLKVIETALERWRRARTCPVSWVCSKPHSRISLRMFFFYLFLRQAKIASNCNSNGMFAELSRFLPISPDSHSSSCSRPAAPALRDPSEISKIIIFNERNRFPQNFRPNFAKWLWMMPVDLFYQKFSCNFTRNFCETCRNWSYP